MKKIKKAISDFIDYIYYILEELHSFLLFCLEKILDFIEFVIDWIAKKHAERKREEYIEILRKLAEEIEEGKRPPLLKQSLLDKIPPPPQDPHTFLYYDFIDILPEIFFLLAFLVLFCVVFVSPSQFVLNIFYPVTDRETSYDLKNPYMGFIVFFLFNIILFYYFVLKLVVPVGSTNYLFFGFLRLSPGVIYYQLIIIFIAFIISLFLHKNYKLSTEFWLVYALFVFSCTTFPSISELLGVYLLFELQGFCSYILAAMNRKNLLSVEAGLKYFVLGAFISGFFLFGLSIIYLAFGTTRFQDIMFLMYGLEPSNFVALGLMLIVSALFFKLASFPFHIWIVDIYSGISLPTLLVFLLLPKLAIWGFLAFQLLPILMLGGVFELFPYTFSVIGLSGVVVGSLGAIYQDNFKKFVAYSGIANTGYIVLALASGSFYSVYTIVYYIIVYAFLMLFFFFFAFAIRTEDTPYHETSLFYLFGVLFKKDRMVGIMGCFLLFSMAGLPPLMGFFPKFYVIASLWSEGYNATALLTAMVSILSAIYYCVLFVRLFINSKDFPEGGEMFVVHEPFFTPSVLAFSAINVFYGFMLHAFTTNLLWCLVITVF